MIRINVGSDGNPIRKVTILTPGGKFVSESDMGVVELEIQGAELPKEMVGALRDILGEDLAAVAEGKIYDLSLIKALLDARVGPSDL